jgi:hypothetical protein
MGALAIAYVLMRPALSRSVEHLAIFEFPVGALLVGTLVWIALKGRRPEPPEPFRRHQQVVRTLPDPALAPYVGALERWVETGEGPEAAADVIAKAATTDAHEQERLRAQLVPDMQVKASRRKRETLLKKQLEQGV